MNIALISYEYPPDTADGGIATYVYQAARMLRDRGNLVEVFAGSRNRDETEYDNGLIIHRTRVSKRMDFSRAIVGVFGERHKIIQFDVIEGPDFLAEARAVVQKYPQIPYVVKLHTPSSVAYKYEKPSLKFLLRIKLGQLRRGINPFKDFERENAIQADLLVSPSRSLGEVLRSLWNLKQEDLVFFPNPFIPSSKMLSIPVETLTNTVTFIGRLEFRKGVIEYAKAIAIVLREIPEAKFRFVGKNFNSPDANLDMIQYLKIILGVHFSSVTFIDKVAPVDIPVILSQTDICVFPSHFDNFPNVCLEAMAAGRGVIGSNSGGMAEMLDSDKVGLLIPPKDPHVIAKAIIELLKSPSCRMEKGRAARNRILEQYNMQVIGEAQEESYKEAIRRRSISKV